MKRLFVATWFLVFLSPFAIGQARDGTAEFQEAVISQPAALIYLPYSPEVVQKAFANYLSETSNKREENAKGYSVSSNTMIAQSNETGADMHFAIGLKTDSNKNESVVYLKLNSFSNDDDIMQRAIQFDMQDAKEYLDNLAIAIKPYATNLQLKLQQKNLSDAQGTYRTLMTEATKLEEDRNLIEAQTRQNKSYKKERSQAGKKAKNDRLIDENLSTRMNLSNDISQQLAALALLTK